MTQEAVETRVPDEEIDRLIEPEIRAAMGDPVPVSLAASLVYVPLGLVGLLGILLGDGVLLGRCATVQDVLVEVGVGAGVGAIMIGLTWLLTWGLAPLRRLRDEFRNLLGPLSVGAVLQLALLSGISEEIVFRGWMQPALGLVITSLIFGAVHFVPTLTFLPWTLFALVAGFILGWLCAWRDSIVAPMVAHVLVNAVNLWLITRGAKPRTAAVPAH